MGKKRNTPADTEANQSSDKQHHFNSAEAQRQRLIKALKQGSVSTVEARRDLDILMPGSRIWELRHREGCDIDLIWVKEQTEAGNLHRVGRYILRTASTQNMPETAGVVDDQ